MADTVSTARAMWTMFEPVHDVTYFAPEALGAFTEAGLRGFWRGYFAGRAAPLRGAPAAVVSASFYNFAPAFVARAIPGVWDLITPQEAIAVRESGAAASLRRLLGGREAEAAEAAGLLWRAVEDLDFAGRVLSAANAELPVSADPLTRLWQATTVLREHRGDGHFAALAAADIDGCEAVVLRCAKDMSRDLMQPVRGWTDEQWGAAAARLTERGWIGEDGTLTAAGRAAHEAVEVATDHAAARPWNRMGAVRLAEVADVLLPLAQACAGALPEVIPVGRLQPTRPGAVTDLGSGTSGLGTWAGTYQFTARRLIAARAIDDVRRAVAAGGRVRALGTRHSFNDLADNGATLVTVTGIAPDPVLDEASRTVTVGAGTTYGAIAAWLQERGWALGNLASLPHISVAGAVATGTHGSGSGNRVLSAAVAGLDYVAADGELRHAGRQDPDFAGMAVGLGAFGIVVRVTVDVEPAYLVRQDVYAGLPWDRVLADLDAIMAAGYSVSLFTDWSGESVQAWVKRRLAGPDDAGPAELFGAGRDPGPARLADSPVDNLTAHGAAGPWSDRLPHFRADVTPSNGDEIQSEYFVARRDGPAALSAIRRLAPLVTPLLLVSEIRSTAADGLWLSGSYDRETLAIHFTWRNRPGPVDGAVREVEAALAPFGARPHWGKVSHITADELRPLYPRVRDARDLFERLDPQGRFSNHRLERLGVRAVR